MDAEGIDELMREAAMQIYQADCLIIAAGAGMGVDSGLPDFRGIDGFWSVYPGLGERNMEFRDVANAYAFKNHPQIAWGFYGHRLKLYRETVPHRGFDILKMFAQKMEHGYTVFTSNVDGQFQKAGFDSNLVVECHGSIHYLQCASNCSNRIWSASEVNPELDSGRCYMLSPLPRCPHCSGLARPNVLMFNNGLWIHDRTFVRRKNQQALLSRLIRPVIIEVGAGFTIPKVRLFAQGKAMHFGVPLIRINVRESAVPKDGDLSIPMGGLEALELIYQHWQSLSLDGDSNS